MVLIKLKIYYLKWKIEKLSDFHGIFQCQFLDFYLFSRVHLKFIEWKYKIPEMEEKGRGSFFIDADTRNIIQKYFPIKHGNKRGP